jgi:class 3 adenylate cyclase/tetratricopeptide (TPR) repeat protein
MLSLDDHLAEFTLSPDEGAAAPGVPEAGHFMTHEEEEALDDEVLGELEGVEQDESRGGQRTISVIFASIHGFDTESDMHQDDIEEIAMKKSDFDGKLTTAIQDCGGQIDKIIRGFFMATFGTTNATKDDPVLAVLGGMRMCEIAEELGVEVHVGVNTGYAWVGQIKTERTIDTTVIGDAVNLSARLKTQAAKNQVVCSPDTYEASKDYFDYEVLRELPPGTLKGIERSMTVYEPMAASEKAVAIAKLRGGDDDRLAALEEHIPEYLKAKIAEGASRLQGERKMVTLLYSDVSGFTALSEKYATQPELIAEVMNRCHKRLGDIVYKHEGVVDKLVGDEIMAIFGAPIMHEDDPERAILCAQEMMVEMDKVSIEVQADFNVPPLSVHIGINTGRVSIGNLVPGSVRMDYTVIGEPTELAEELEDISKGGEIIVGQRTYRMTRALYNFEERGPITVGGKEVPCYLVLDKKELADSKRGLTEMGDVPMIGRQKQYDQSMACLDQIFEGKSPISTTIGEAGYGKSRLMREARTALEAREGLWFFGTCFPNTEQQGYSLFLRLFESYFDVKDADSGQVRRTKLTEKLEEVYDGDTAAMEDVLPYVGNMMSVPFEGALGDKIAFLDPEQLQRRTFVAVRDLFVHEASRQPIVVALDDLHWLDNVSNDLIYFLLENIYDAPVYFMNIYRPERRDLCWAIGDTAAERYPERYTAIAIDPLSPDAQVELCDALLPMGADGTDIKATIVEKSDGNPFYMEEFIRVLLDDEFIKKEGDVWKLIRDVSEFAVPDSLEQMLSARIDKLPDASKEVLQSASVVGRKFEHDTLIDAVEDSSDLDDCLAYLTDLDFVEEATVDPLEYIFGHIVTFEISYSAIVVGRRRQIHQKVGDSFEERHTTNIAPYLELLAYHYAESTERSKAVHYLGRAGSKARDMFNNKDAVSFYERGLEFLGRIDEPNRTDQLEILNGLGDVYAVLGQYEDGIEAINNALELAEEPMQTAVGQRKLGSIYRQSGDWDTADQRYDEALTVLGGLNGADETRIEEARVRDMKGFISYSRGDFADGDEKCRAALALVDDLQALDVKCSIFKNLGNINLRLGQADDALGFYTQGIDFADRVGDKMLQSQLYNNLFVLHRIQARTDDALASIRKAIDLGEQMAFADGLTARYASLGMFLRQTGDNEGALENLNHALEIATRIQSPQRVAEAEASLGTYYFYVQDYEKYIEHNVSALDPCRQIGDRQRETQCLVNISDGYLYLGKEHVDEAERYATDAQALAEELTMSVSIIAATKNLGMVSYLREEYTEALSRFQRALDMAIEDKTVDAQAEIYRLMGDTYLDMGDNVNARESLTQSADLYDQLGSDARATEIRERMPDA